MADVSKTVQFRFTRGELNPKLDGRADIEQYYSSAEKIENAFIIPQGGAIRRPGLAYLDSVRNVLSEYDGSGITASDPQGNNSNSGSELSRLTNGTLGQYYTTTTAISTTNEYVVFQYDMGSIKTVTFVDLEQISLSSGSNNEFVLQYSAAAIFWNTAPITLTIDTVERDYRIPIESNLVRYIRLIRVGTTNLGSAVIKLSECNVWQETNTLSNSKLFPFQFSDTQDYLLLMTDQSITVYKNGILQCNINSPYTSSQVPLVNYTQSIDTAIFFHPQVNPHELERQGGDTLWSFNPINFTNIPTYRFDNTVLTPAATLTVKDGSDTNPASSGLVTLTASAGTPFNTSTFKVGQYIDGNGGTVRLTERVSDIKVKGYCVTNFYDSTVIASGQWTYETGWDALWSPTRGYARTGCFFQQRLVMGGFGSDTEGKSANVIAASEIENFYNFDQGAINDSDAFFYELATDQANVIYHLFPHNVLEIYTSGGEFVTMTDNVNNVTFSPKTRTINRQSQIGCSPYIRPVEIENGGTLFVQKEGRSVSEFIYSDATISYENRRLSLISGHLIDHPIDASLRRSTNDQEANYYLQVNQDGRLIVACLLQTENIGAFTQQNTDGLFKNVVAIDENMYVVVQRVINGTTKNYLEELTFDRFTDCSIYKLAAHVPSVTITGLNYLEGKQVWTIIDGSVYDKQTVSSGTITLANLPTVGVEIGLDYNPLIITNSIENPDMGSFMGRMKSLPEVVVNLYDTQHILINGYSPIRELFGPLGTLDESPVSFTDRYRMLGFLGWDQYGQLTITQKYPLKMTLLNLKLTYIVGNK